GYGMYAPASLIQSLDRFARSSPSMICRNSVSSGDSLTHARSAWPLLFLRGYCAQNWSKSCSCRRLLNGDRGLFFDEGLSIGASWVSSCASSGAHIVLSSTLLSSTLLCGFSGVETPPSLGFRV